MCSVENVREIQRLGSEVHRLASALHSAVGKLFYFNSNGRCGSCCLWQAPKQGSDYGRCYQACYRDQRNKLVAIKRTGNVGFPARCYLATRAEFGCVLYQKSANGVHP